MKIHSLVIATALAGALIAQPVIAGSIQVQFDDLDLSTPKGQKELNARLTRAAKDVCAANSVSTGTILRSKAEAACVKETRAQLQKRVAALIEDKASGG